MPMFSFDEKELDFARKYPFSDVAKSIVKNSGFNLEDVPVEVLLRAVAMVSSAYADEKYDPKILSSKELMLNEIMAFPVSKILVSIINKFELTRKFCNMVSSVVFKHLEADKDDVLIDLASEFGIRITLSDEGDFFAEIPVADYLKPELSLQFTKLVNSKVSTGKVFLTRNDFAMFISMLVRQQLIDSLPAPVEGIPDSFTSAASGIEADFINAAKRIYSKTDFGEIAPEYFPPCMAKIYSDLISGANVSHSGRFVFAAFAASVGMESEKLIDLFRQTPNFNERVTRYQVERIAGVKGKAYNSPSCDKMRSYNLCVAECRVSHPVQFYSREFFKKDSVADSAEEESEQENEIDSENKKLN
ncbi:MAG: hypothetical protein COV47_03650 [Candidatus Diapherotrites archaeon CG11_big_fil_rev_8_21_14_0_20_37_9]|nr:MAG: hypothetical protein COV47_03650 [Candidatus Diapherotrites archaeon CG11_big_fil_rev_8_21_14_0_20_37_9]